MHPGELDNTAASRHALLRLHSRHRATLRQSWHAEYYWQCLVSSLHGWVWLLCKCLVQLLHHNLSHLQAEGYCIKRRVEGQDKRVPLLLNDGAAVGVLCMSYDVVVKCQGSVHLFWCTLKHPCSPQQQQQQQQELSGDIVILGAAVT